MSSSNHHTPAIILGMDSLTSLGVVRCLAEKNVPLIGVDPVAHGYAVKSRFLKDRILFPRDLENGLLQLLGLDSYWGSVLIPVTDLFVTATARLREKLSKRFRLFTPPWSVLVKCVDKWEMYLQAQSIGIPTPTTFCPSDEGELGALIDSGRLRKGGWLVKPRSILPIHRSQEVFGSHKAILPKSPDDLRSICLNNFLRCGSFPIIQQFVTGGHVRNVFANIFMDGNSKVLGAITYSRVRSYPVDFGAASCTETIKEPCVLEQTVRFYRSIGFFGTGSAEFIFDEAEGRYKFNEVNPRFGLSIILHKACGLNSPWLFYRCALEENMRREFFGFPEGLRSVLASDFVSIWQNRHSMGLRKPLLDLFRNLPRVRAFESFSLRDPLPLIAFFADKIAERSKILLEL